MNNMTLNQLMKHVFPKFQPISKKDDLVIAELQLDSRYISVNDLFIGIIGHQIDGRQYVMDAIKKGALGCLLQTNIESEHLEYTEILGCPVIKILNLPYFLSTLGDFFYHSPSEHHIITGVTGTNGKTTVSQLIAQWASLLGKKTAVLGTIGNGLLNQLTPSENTTASAIELQRKLADFVAHQVQLTAMEVSSHGLVQGRVNHIKFDVVAFTNLSHDHLDYHHTMQQYEVAKWTLFTISPAAHQVINIDDEVGYRWLQKLPKAIAVNIQRPLPKNFQGKFVSASEISYDQQGAQFKVCSSWGEARVCSPLIGAFNVSNILVALATLLALGFDFKELIVTLNQLIPICGRMERFAAKGQPTVLVDYAHTPDGLTQALIAARNHCQGKLWCVFGCGGDRDTEKRPKMAEIAEQLADYIVITDDNPRTESSLAITEQIIKGLNYPQEAKVIHNRIDAIKYAIEHAQHNDLILIAGKGHEEYQIVGTKKLPYSERKKVAEILGIML